MCGDSSSEADVERLLDGAKPRLMVTDPPYGVEYDPDWRNRDLPGQFARARIDRPMGDDMPPEHWASALDVFAPDVAYVWSPPGDHNIAFAVAIQQRGYTLRSSIIWRKQHLVVSRGHYHWQHEPCWYGVKRGSTAGWIGDRAQSTVWDIANLNPMGSNDEAKTTHSTQKPVECMERPIRNHEGDVYDPFVGSGTTSIAAERQGRACYAMEIEPRYVDMAVKRWEDYTGQKAERIEEHADPLRRPASRAHTFCVQFVHFGLSRRRCAPPSVPCSPPTA